MSTPTSSLTLICKWLMAFAIVITVSPSSGANGCKYSKPEQPVLRVGLRPWEKTLATKLAGGPAGRT